MAQNVIGIFDTDDQARTAVEALVAANFNRDKIFMAPNDMIKGRGDMTDEKNTLSGKAGRLFMDIFSDTKDALRYAAVAEQGSVVIFEAENMDEALQAADLLDASGAINVNDRATLLEDSWTRQDRTAGYGNPEVKIFPGVAEYDKTDEPVDQDTRVEDRVASSGDVRVRSRIVDRPAGDNVRIREAYTEVTPSKNEDIDTTQNLL